MVGSSGVSHQRLQVSEEQQGWREGRGMVGGLLLAPSAPGIAVMSPVPWKGFSRAWAGEGVCPQGLSGHSLPLHNSRPPTGRSRANPAAMRKHYPVRLGPSAGRRWGPAPQTPLCHGITQDGKEWEGEGWFPPQPPCPSCDLPPPSCCNAPPATTLPSHAHE